MMERLGYGDEIPRWHPKGASGSRHPPGESQPSRAVWEHPQGPIKPIGPLPIYFQGKPNPAMPSYWRPNGHHTPTIKAPPLHQQPRANGSDGSRIPRPKMPRPNSAHSASSSRMLYSMDEDNGPRRIRPQSANASSSSRKWSTADVGERPERREVDKFDDRLYHVAKDLSNISKEEAPKEEEQQESGRRGSGEYGVRGAASNLQRRPSSAPLQRSGQMTPAEFKRPTTAKPRRPSKELVDVAGETPIPAVSSSSPPPPNPPSRQQGPGAEESYVLTPHPRKSEEYNDRRVYSAEPRVEEYRLGTKAMHMQLAGIPDRNAFPFGACKGWAAKRRHEKAMYSFNPIRHTVDKFEVKDGRLQQERTVYTDPVPHLNSRKYNRTKGVVEYADITRPTGERWNPSYQDRYRNNRKVFYNKTGTLVAFVDTMLRQGINPNIV